MLKNSITDWKNAFYRLIDQHDKLVQHVEKMEHNLEKESKIRRDGEVGLVEAMTTIRMQQPKLQQWTEVAQPLADMVEPPVEGAEPRPLVKKL